MKPCQIVNLLLGVEWEKEKNLPWLPSPLITAGHQLLITGFRNNFLRKSGDPLGEKNKKNVYVLCQELCMKKWDKI